MQFRAAALHAALVLVPACAERLYVVPDMHPGVKIDNDQEWRWLRWRRWQSPVAAAVVGERQPWGWWSRITRATSVYISDDRGGWGRVLLLLCSYQFYYDSGSKKQKNYLNRILQYWGSRWQGYRRSTGFVRFCGSIWIPTNKIKSAFTVQNYSFAP